MRNLMLIFLLKKAFAILCLKTDPVMMQQFVFRPRSVVICGV